MNWLPTDDRLAKYGLSLCSCCSICMQEGENDLHLSIRCPIAHAVWLFIANLFQVNFVEVDSISGFLVHFMNFKFNFHPQALFYVVVMAAFSIIWFARYSIHFDDLPFSLEKAWIYIS